MAETVINSKSFGVVIYMDNEEYADTPEENETIHFHSTKDEIMIGLIHEFYNLKINAVIDNIVIGHEHGTDLKKCHMQVFIEFTTKIRKNIKPGSFTIGTNKYLYMAQKSKTPKKLRNYCKKDGDFIELFPCKSIKDILRENNILDSLMDVEDPYETLLTEKKLKDEQIISLFKNCQVTEYRKNFVNNSKQIFETYKKYIKEEEEEIKFEWLFPKHIYEHIENNFGGQDKVSLAYVKMYTWFKTYCEPEGYFRRKALFLFSLAGGVGKSYFARSLVPEISICNSPFYVYCRGTLDASEFLKKIKTARLVILDDVNYISNDIEIWKAITVGEPTNIRTPYHNIAWPNSLPCIMMSNNIKTLKYWMETEDLKGRCIFVGIDFYIGPPGTDNEVYHTTDFILTDDILNKLSNKKIDKCNSF